MAATIVECHQQSDQVYQDKHCCSKTAEGSQARLVRALTMIVDPNLVAIDVPADQEVDESLTHIDLLDLFWGVKIVIYNSINYLKKF